MCHQPNFHQEVVPNLFHVDKPHLKGVVFRLVRHIINDSNVNRVPCFSFPENARVPLSQGPNLNLEYEVQLPNHAGNCQISQLISKYTEP